MAGRSQEMLFPCKAQLRCVWVWASTESRRLLRTLWNKVGLREASDERGQVFDPGPSYVK